MIRTLSDAKYEFIDVKILVMNSAVGGAEAKSFESRHNSMYIDLTLGITIELHSNIFIIGGFNKVFEIGRMFRNEGNKNTHYAIRIFEAC